jgi:hypothetical protein
MGNAMFHWLLHVLDLHADILFMGGGAVAVLPGYQSKSSFFAAEMLTFIANMATYYGEDYGGVHDAFQNYAQGWHTNVV